LLRAVIETRKDQIAGLSYAVRSRDPAGAPDAGARIQSTLAFLAQPDRRHSFAAWLRMLLEDLLVIDAATIYPRFTRGGSLYSLDVIDGSTITPLIGEDGRSPEPPDPAYQQVLHGVPAADFSSDELLYLPRNVRSHRLYGMSPVEQIALTVNIALRRDAATLDYYRAGSVPDSFATLPREWTTDQIKQFQDYFDALMSGNLARRHMVKFMPADFKLTETRQPPLKDQYDEWLARVICYAFSVPASAFVSQVNRATSETLRMQATQEGLVPLKAWVKTALDQVVQVYLKQADLEFVWVGDDAVDPLEQAQTLNILVSAGIKTREEARADLGLAPEGGTTQKSLHKFNPYHDRSNGRFTTAEGAGAAQNPSPTLIAYPGDYHDILVQHELEQYRAAGSQCLSEVNLSLGEVNARIDILCRTPVGQFIGVDVKTGENPRLTPEQAIVYSHTLEGGISSPDPKIAALGVLPNQTIPPFPVFFVYSRGPGEPKRFFGPSSTSPRN
jgi:hypothetical protein